MIRGPCWYKSRVENLARTPELAHLFCDESLGYFTKWDLYGSGSEDLGLTSHV